MVTDDRRHGGSTIPGFPPPKRHPYDQWSPDTRALDLVGDKWTLLIVRDLAAGPRRFVELQRVLPGISTEQLRSRLNRMVADGLLTRQRYREVPPRVDYELTERARDLMPILGALARWGFEWTWSEPRSGEDVDVGAILRLAPGLVSLPRAVRGTAVFSATGKQGKPRDYVLRATAGRVEITEPAEAPSDADARVAGTHRSWVAALGPDGDRSGLEVEGDSRLAEALLDGVAPAKRANSKAA
ncbi:MAG TPA: helix-turn-helix domain-containing protein [Solirubrobacteraceae bacterium]|nr:helix-turn-helix domain-containing protein [Solirubrobacteraceae bacterium]